MKGALCVPAKSHFALSAHLIGGRENVCPVFVVYQHPATPFLICGDWRTAAAPWTRVIPAGSERT